LTLLVRRLSYTLERVSSRSLLSIFLEKAVLACLLSMFFIGSFFNFKVQANEYEAIISPRNVDSSLLDIVYEGNTKEELRNQVKEMLDKTLLFENSKLSNLNSKNLTAIQKDRDLKIGILDTVKAFISIKGLATNFSSKTLSNEEFQKAVKSVVATILPLVTKELSEKGLIFPDNKDLEGLVGVLVGAIAQAIQSDFSASVTPLDYLSLGIDVLAFATNVDATMDVNNFLYYQLSAPITDTYIRYYADSLINRSGKLLSVDEFINDRYYHPSSSSVGKEILTKSEYKDAYSDTPDSRHSLRNALRLQGRIINAEDYNSFKDYLFSFPSILVGTWIDIATVNLEPYRYSDLKAYINKMVEQRLRLIRLPISNYPVLRLSIKDNFEVNSKKRHGMLIVPKDHYISNLSNYSIFEIGTFPLTETEVVCEEFSDFKASNTIKLSNYGIFDSTECRGPNNLSFNFTFQNGEKWTLFDDFFLENRYVGRNSNASVLIKYIKNLKKHSIDFKNDIADINVNSKISQYEFSNQMYDGFDDFKKLYPINDYENFYTKLNEYFRPDLQLTYQQFFEIIHTYLSAMSPELNDNFWLKNGAAIFPSNSSNLSIYINRERAKAREFDALNYIKYIDKLSQSGIIKFEVFSVIKKLNEPIPLKDYLKYMSNLMDLLNIKPGKE